MAHRIGQIVRIRDRLGRPLEGVTLVVRSAQAAVPEMAYVTGPDGCVQLGLPPGPAELEAHASDGTVGRFTIDAASKPGHRHDWCFGESAR